MFIDTQYCYVCKKNTQHQNAFCGECVEKKETKELEAHLAENESKSIIDRIRVIEITLYNQSKQRRI